MLVMTACGNLPLADFFGRFFDRYLRNIQQVIVQIWITKCDLNKDEVWMMPISTWKILLL